ncbi:MAG: CBS domain-containing protein [Candidatus Thorarchaeota archaeon]
MESNEVWACCEADVVVGFPDYSIKEVLTVLHTNRFRRLPIVDRDNELQGIIVISDIIRWLQLGPGNVDEKAKAIMTGDLITIEATETVQTATKIMRENNISCLPIVLEGARLVGIITERDILNFKGVAADHLNTPVSEFLRDDELLTLPVDVPVQEVLDKLVEKTVRRALLIENEKLVGILTAADILDAFIAEGEAMREKLAREIATPNVLFVSPKTPISAAVALMRQENIGQLPIVEDGRIIGVFTERDCVLMLAET